MRLSIFLTLIILLAGCAPAKAPVLAAGAESIRFGRADPPADMAEIGPISVEHGNGCGAFGSLGTYEGAYIMLKNRSLELGADYVQIMEQVEPRSENGCFDNRYVIRGIAYQSAGADA